MNNITHQLTVASRKLIDLKRELELAYEETGEDGQPDFDRIDNLETEVYTLEAHIFDLEDELSKDTSMYSRADYL